ncbi:glycosyltransferase [Pontibacter virosus]|uniref:Glycosyl transferase family 2 n=1 Tax=Pontibacter virosus TaxID=1765052 RepID=A0A2U1ARM3_9BACT|nr:glycosyltransferase [Pontibacter virosus]PVY39042.1 glycosyl transferase family 2 [Pontibacter virosus]
MSNDIVILIPHYNNPAGLESSLNSIAFPTPINVLVVDDGSHTKPDEQRLRQRFQDRLSITFLYNQVNEGIERTLNNGLNYIQEQMRCQYIARLDCGDTCAPDRFIKQKQHLDAHPDVYLIGSWVAFVDGEGKKVYTYRAPAEHKDIVKNMYLKCSFIHPSVMFRAAALKEIGTYPVNYKAAEDYAFFFRFIQRYKTYIIPEVLTYCEINTGGISHTKRNVQLKSKIRILLDNKSASPYFVAGLLRNFALRALPYRLVAKAKAILLK